ncbi:uncharacterized protein TNCT_59271 [Trichonephila clavata]|uniref:Uncharacterized protein n=1 Tax=Trichonephila clavata TaxID=2740835 RepID=A0A8X6G034_TRICU|nr:uncharacterized protein TNCT_59271 [Trichonephila clavata]
MSPTEECAEAYCEFAKIIRNSLYYNIFFDVLLLTVSISALFLGMLFINECTRHFELIFMVLLMGVNGLLCSLSRMAPLVFSKLGMVGSKWIFKTCAVIFLTLFALIGFVEMVLMASFAKYVLCSTFVYYMVYVNFGVFLLGILTFFLYVEVLIDALMSLNPNSLLRWMRMLCTC